MVPDMEEMIRQRAYTIWEQEGCPAGRHEAHWQLAAGQITRDLEQIKAAHDPATGREKKAATALTKSRPRHSQPSKSGSGAIQPRSAGISGQASVAGGTRGTELHGSEEDQPNMPRKRGRKPAKGTPSEMAMVAAITTPRRGTPRTKSARVKPAAGAAPVQTSQREKSEAANAGLDASPAARPAGRGRKLKV
jgi:hypothetical protein